MITDIVNNELIFKERNNIKIYKSILFIITLLLLLILLLFKLKYNYIYKTTAVVYKENSILILKIYASKKDVEKITKNKSLYIKDNYITYSTLYNTTTNYNDTFEIVLKIEDYKNINNEDDIMDIFIKYKETNMFNYFYNSLVGGIK